MAGMMGWRPPAPGAPQGYNYRWTTQQNPHGSYLLEPGGGEGVGSGLPTGGAGMGMGGAGMGMPMDLLNQFKGLFGQVQSGKGPPLPQPPPVPGAGQSQYLQELRALMAKMGGGLPQLDPTMQRQLQEAKNAMSGEINRTYEQMMGNEVAQLYGRGMEQGSQDYDTRGDVAGRKSQAISEMLSGLFGQEVGMRQGLGQMQQQGIMSQAGILQQLMGGEDAARQTQYSMEQQRYDQELQRAQIEEQRRQQQMQMMMSLFSQFPQIARLSGMR